MTPRERFIAALKRRPLTGRVPHFELVFYLTMEAFGRVHPSHRTFAQWDQMSKYPHPTAHATRYNVRLDTGIFDYRSSQRAYSTIENYTIGDFVIVPVLQCLLCYPTLIPFTEEEFNQLRPLVDEVMSV